MVRNQGARSAVPGMGHAPILERQMSRYDTIIANILAMIYFCPDGI